MPARRREVALPPFVPWEGLGGIRAEIVGTHRQGEHVSGFGPSGSGKTTALVSLLTGFHELGGHCVMLANKARTQMLTKFVTERPDDWSRITSWPPEYGHRVKRGLVLWPPYPGTDTEQRKRVRETMVKAIDAINREGGWYVYLDEANYLVEQLRLREYLDELWQQARSSDVSVLAGAQRPVWTSKAMTTQQKWIMAWRPENEDDGAKVALSLGGRARWGTALDELSYHAFVVAYLPRRIYYTSDTHTSTGRSQPGVQVAQSSPG